MEKFTAVTQLHSGDGKEAVTEARKKLPEMVAENIRSMIIREAWGQGDKLPTENELMQRYGVSRSTIREAVKTLQAERVVEIRRGCGTYVTDKPGMVRDPLGLDFTDQERLLPNLLETRMLIEPGIACLAAKRRTAGQMSKMAEAIEQMEAAYAQGKDYTPHDYQFHMMMAQCTQNDVLNRILPTIYESIEAGYIRTAHVAGSYQRAVTCHQGLLDAIERGDDKAAENIAQLHIEQTLNDALEYMKNKEDTKL